MIEPTPTRIPPALAPSRRRFPMVLRTPFATLLSLSLLFGSALTVRADIPTDPNARAKVVGSPKSLQVQPDKLILDGPRSTAQLVVTGVYADGTVRDLTHFADFKLDSGDL